MNGARSSWSAVGWKRRTWIGCLIAGCRRPHLSLGWCATHYMRWYTHGSTDLVEESDESRFWRQVQKTDSCWLWTGGRTNGYGRFWLTGKTVMAHRLAYEWLVGPIP